MTTHRKLDTFFIIVFLLCLATIAMLVYRNSRMPSAGPVFGVSCPADPRIGWAYYETDDGRVSFEYPQQAWALDTTNESDGVTTLSMSKNDPSNVIQIEEVAHNGITFSDAVSNFEHSTPGAVETHYVLNNSQITELSNKYAKMLFTDKAGYYVTVSVPVFGDPAYDCLSKEVLESLYVMDGPAPLP